MSVGRSLTQVSVEDEEPTDRSPVWLSALTKGQQQSENSKQEQMPRGNAEPGGEGRGCVPSTRGPSQSLKSSRGCQFTKQEEPGCRPQAAGLYHQRWVLLGLSAWPRAARAAVSKEAKLLGFCVK